MYMEIDTRNQSLQSSMDRRIKEACQDENLLTMAVAYEYIINLKRQVVDLTKQLGKLGE